MAVFVFDTLAEIKEHGFKVYPADNAHGWMCGKLSWEEREYRYGDTLEEAVLMASGEVKLRKIFAENN